MICDIFVPHRMMKHVSFMHYYEVLQTSVTISTNHRHMPLKLACNQQTQGGGVKTYCCVFSDKTWVLDW
jgi:hypothetical protein